MTKSRKRNIRLHALLQETGLTQQALADAVNQRAAEAGRSLHYDRTTVAHWLAGSRPRDWVIPLLLGALGRILQRDITPAQAGFDRPAGNPPSHRAEVHGSALGRLASLADAKLPSRLYRVPRWGSSDVFAPTGHIAVSVSDISPHAVRFFAGAFECHGGNFARSALHTYLHDTVRQQIRSSRTSALRRRHCIEAARLTLLLGRMYQDDLLHGAAQHCYATATHLSEMANEPAGWATGLRMTSQQALLLGRPNTAGEAITRALDVARHGSAAVQAYVYAQLALSTASANDPTAALSALRSAEAAHDQAEPRGGPFEAYPLAALEYQRAETLAALGDNMGALRAFEDSLHHRPPGEQRCAVLTRVRLATHLLSLGRVQQARAHEHEIRAGLSELGTRSAERTAHVWQQAMLRQGRRPRSPERGR